MALDKGMLAFLATCSPKQILPSSSHLVCENPNFLPLTLNLKSKVASNMNISNHPSISSTESNLSIWQTLVTIGALWLVYRYLRPVPYVPGLPVINRAERWDIFSIRTKRRFLNQASELVREGFEKVIYSGISLFIARAHSLMAKVT